MKRITTLIIAIISFCSLSAQNEYSDFLKVVEANNLKLKSFRDFANSKILESKTGLNPENPEFEIGFMPGNVDDKGNMTTMKLSQSFDFPMVYLQKSKLAGLYQNQFEYQFKLNRIEVLAEATRYFFERIYSAKSISLKTERRDNASRLVKAFEQKMQNGDANIIELNKLRLELSLANKQLAIDEIRKINIEQQLVLFTAGAGFEFASLIYPVIPDFKPEEYVSAYYEIDPEYVLLKSGVNLVQEELKLEKAKTLPEISLSYNYENTPEVRYAGPAASLSIPLWQNKNKVNTARASLEYSESKLKEGTLSLVNVLKEKKARLSILKNSIDEMQSVISSSNTVKLLNRALEMGEISLITYIYEIDYFYEANYELLELELSYFLLKADLNKIYL